MESDAEKIKREPSVEGSDYSFYRCKSCGHIFTRLEEKEAMSREGEICQCGGRQYRPTWPVGDGPPDDMNPGDGKDLAPSVAKAKFDEAMSATTGEWKDERVRHFAWLRFLGMA